MPTVGLEYRYPFINVQPWGTTTIEPIAQVIIRPNETYAGRLPNEDAQSLVFDASNLFSVDKFSGYDRVEGGGRANVGVQATTQFDQGGSINFLFGQSYQLFGLNSFAVADLTNTGVDSGLQRAQSDYVASLNYSPNRIFTFSTRARFDEATMNVQRFEAELLRYMRAEHKGILDDIRDKREITKETGDKLKAAVDKFAKSFA